MAVWFAGDVESGDLVAPAGFGSGSGIFCDVSADVGSTSRMM